MQSNTKELSDNDLKLELVQVIFRHGARTLVRQELDLLHKLNDASSEAQSSGELTNEGKTQVYDLGLFLRERYRNFLSEHYKSDEVYAYSSDTCRTRMSLQLVLAGLYPPVGRAVWNPNLTWSPAICICPPKPLDVLLRCCIDSPKCRKLRADAYRSQEFRTKISKYSDFLDFLTSEMKINFADDLLYIFFIHGIVTVHERMNLPLPDWYEVEMKDKLKELMGFAVEGLAFTLQSTKLSAGPLIKTLIENMNLRETNINTRKIYLYCGHDVNLMLFTKAHNIDGFFPEVGSALILEKLRDRNNRVFVRLLARTGSATLTTLQIGDHKEFCPIDDYLSIVEPVLPSESEIDEMLEDLSVAKIKSLFFSDPVVKKSTE